MKDGLPKYAKHREEGAPMIDEEEDADRSHGRGEHKDKHEARKYGDQEANDEEKPSKRQKMGS